MPRKIEDIYGRKWEVSKKELCPTCLQPDNVGECRHKKLSKSQVITLGGKLPEKEFPFKIRVHQSAMDHKRLDSFWYDGQVATIPTKDGCYSLEAVGDIKVMFEPNGTWYSNYNAVQAALSPPQNFTDRKLSNLSNHDGWSNNNWFSVVFIKNDGTVLYPDGGEVEYNYHSVIEMLKSHASNWDISIL